MTWFDTHCHLDLVDAAELVRAKELGVRSFVVPCVTGDSSKAAAIAAAEPDVAYLVGVHPLFLGGMTDEGLDALLRQMRGALTGDPRCVGVGEVGLDFTPEGVDRELQRRVFSAQVELAAELGCPVVVHLRKGWDELLEVARRHARLVWIFHMFSGSVDVAERYLRALPAAYFGFGGPAARDNAKKPRGVLRAVPSDRILVETDAPDLTPPPLEPPNTPANLPWIGGRLAGALGITADELAATSTANARRALQWKNASHA